jgi:hypothetical protein
MKKKRKSGFAPFFGLLLAVACSCGYGTESRPSMRVQFTTEGGIAHFPGLSRPVVIDSDQLSQEEEIKLRQLVEAARFFDLPEKAVPPPRGAADYYRYTITIEEGGRQHTVQLSDPVQEPALQQLLVFLRTKAKALRAPGRTPAP